MALNYWALATVYGQLGHWEAYDGSRLAAPASPCSSPTKHCASAKEKRTTSNSNASPEEETRYRHLVRLVAFNDTGPAYRC